MGIFIYKEKWMRHARLFFALLFLSAFVLGLLYVYYMNVVVLKMAERSKTLAVLSETEREFQELEMFYMSKLSELDIDYAQSRGFVLAEPDAYVYKHKRVARLDE